MRDMRKRVDMINRLDRDLERLKKLMELYDDFPYVVLSNNPSRRDSFYEQDKDSKRVSAMSRIEDLPDDININQLVYDAIKNRHREKQEELEQLLKAN